MGLSASVGGKDQVFRRSSLEPSDDVGDDDDVDNIDDDNESSGLLQLVALTCQTVCAGRVQLNLGYGR